MLLAAYEVVGYVRVLCIMLVVKILTSVGGAMQMILNESWGKGK